MINVYRNLFKKLMNNNFKNFKRFPTRPYLQLLYAKPPIPDITRNTL
jgi:hypothetical protein